MHPSRRRWLIGLLVVAALAASCSSSHGREPATDAAQTAAPTCTVKMPAKAATPVTVKVVETFDTRSAAAAATLVDQFNKSQHQVKVVLQPVGDDNAVQQALGSSRGSASGPSLVVLDEIDAQTAVDSGKVLPAGLCQRAAGTNTGPYLPSAKAYYTVDGDEQAASANLTAPVLYVDKAAFRAAGLDPADPPQTLDQVYQDAVKLKQADPTQIPLAMTQSSWWIETWLTGAGVAIVNNNNGRSSAATGSTLAGAHAVATEQWLQKMYTADLIDLLPDSAGSHAAELDIAAHKSSMLFASSATIPDMDALEAGTLDPTTWNQPEGTVLPPAGTTLDLDVAPLPGLDRAGRGQVTGSAWYLVGDLPPATQAAAWAFMTWWNQPAQQATWSLQSTYLPYNAQAVNQSELEQVWQNTRKGHWLDTAYTAMTNIDSQSPGPLIGPYSAVRSLIAASMAQVTAGGMDPQVAISQTDRAMENLLVAYTLSRASS